MKKWILFVLGGLLILSLTGCDLLFGAKDVKARNLEPFTTGTLPGDKDETLLAMTMGGAALGMAMGDFFDSDKFYNAWDSGMEDRYPVFRTMFLPKAKDLPTARDITVSGYFSDNATESDVQIKDETVAGYISGLVTVKNFDGNYSASYTENADYYPTSMSVNFAVNKCSILVSNDYDGDMGYVINSAEMNVDAKGEGGATITWPDVIGEEDIPSKVAVNYDVDIQYKGGFSMSADASDGYCGKFIFEIILKTQEDFSYDVETAYDDYSSGDTPSTPDLDLSVVIEVYNNNNDLIAGPFTYTQDDLIDFGTAFAEDMMI